MIRFCTILFFALFYINHLQAQTDDSSKPKTPATQVNTKQKKAAAKQDKPAAKRNVLLPATTEPPKDTAPKSAAKKPAVQPSKQNQPAAKRNVLLRNDAVSKQKDTTKHTVKPSVKKPSLKPVQKKDSLTAKKTVITPKPATARRDSAVHKKTLLPVRRNLAKKDSLAKADSIRRVAALAARQQAGIDSARTRAAIADSLQKAKQLTALTRSYLLTWRILSKHPYFAMATRPVITPYSKRDEPPGKELYFYTLTGILLLFAGFKTAFSKYFDDLTTLFFKRTLKQRQLQQQLSQNTLPSFLFNILYTLVAGFYLTLLAQQLSFQIQHYPVWQVFSVSVIFIAAIYLAKFFLLKLCGWLFNIKNLTDAYIFLIFLVNKIITLFLLPVIIIVALGGTGIKTIIWTLSWLVIAALFLYRFFVTIQMVQKNNKVSLFHFLLYFLAFELLPLFVIYRFILLFLT